VAKDKLIIELASFLLRHEPKHDVLSPVRTTRQCFDLASSIVDFLEDKLEDRG
jgi:hypothetical protein